MSVFLNQSLLVLFSLTIRESSTYIASKLYIHPPPSPVTDMSRAFSTAVRALKSLSWNDRGTSQNVAWVKNYAENAVDHVPQLVDKVDSGTVQYA